MKAAFCKEMKEPFLLDTSSSQESDAHPNLRRRLKILEFHVNKSGAFWEASDEGVRSRAVMEGAAKAGFAPSEAEKVSAMVVQAIRAGASEAQWP